MIDLAALPPGLTLLIAGLLALLAPRAARTPILMAAPLLTLAQIWTLPDGVALAGTWLSYDIVPVKADALSRVFGTVFAVTAFAGALFAHTRDSTTELAAAFAYAGSSIGVVFAGDLLTLFVFWEMMAIFSTVVVMSGGPGARGPGLRYAAIHFFGGVLLMIGIAGEIGATGSTSFAAMDTGSAARWLILAAFLINAAAFPASAWLPDAYPASSWTGMVFLSAFTTKTAVYVLMVGFPGTELLIYVGLGMIFYGIIFAILENDMRRILAYSVVNQVGFMVTAVGIGTELALNGAAAHAFAHILYKALLLMSAGSVLLMTGRSKCTDLGGLYRTMPVTCICGIVGALAISAFPLTSGFVAKSMISSASGKEQMLFVWIGLTAASAGAFLYVGLKFPWFVFFERDSGLRPSDPHWTMQAAMILLCVLCVGLGVWYTPLYAILPFDAKYDPYTGGHIVLQLQLLLFAGLVFFLLRGFVRAGMTVTLDIDWFWRKGGKAAGRAFLALIGAIWRGVASGTVGGAEGAAALLYRYAGPLGTMARTKTTGAMAFWMAVLLVGWLVLYYLA